MPKGKKVTTKAKVAVEPEEQVEEVAEEATPVETRFFRNSQYSGLMVSKGEENGKTVGVRFVPYFEMWQGERVKVGYWAGSGHDAELMAGTMGSVEISEKEYRDATGEKSQRAPTPL